MRNEAYDYGEIAEKYGYSTCENSEIKKLYLKWKNSLTLQEKRCLWLYRINSVALNKYLRNEKNERWPKWYLNMLKRIDEGVLSALNKGFLNRNIAVYRRLASGESDFLESRHVGDTIVGDEYCGYKGTHVDKTIAKKYLNLNLPKAFAVYLLPEKTSCAYINYWVAIFMMEHELLINKNYSYKLLEKDAIFERDLYVLELIKK